MEVGTEVGGCGVGVDVYVRVCVGVWVGEEGTRVLNEGTALSIIGTEGVDVGGDVVWVKGSDDILPGLQAEKITTETITKRMM